MADPYFATERDNDPISCAARLGRESEYALYSNFADDGADIVDFDLQVAKYRSASGKSKHEIERGVLGYFRLRELPRLRELQAHTLRLDTARLGAIDAALNLLGDTISEEAYRDFDTTLVRMFTPTKVAQELPSPWSITRTLRRMIAQRDPSVAFNAKKRKDRNNPDPREDASSFFESVMDGITQQGMELLTNSTTMALIRTQVDTLSREEKISHTAAVIDLLSGQRAPRKVVLNVYSPHGRSEGDPVNIPGFGWTDPAATAAFDELIKNAETAVRDLDAAASTSTESYIPTDDIKAAVHARDGVCIFPGCHQPADRCQLDHRIPFDEGGPTTAHNLFTLCQHHHNIKAYRRTKEGIAVPLMWRTDSKDLGKFQYAMLTNKQYAAVSVVDIDQPGTQGGHPINLARELRSKLFKLVARGIGPAWVGINRLSGKAHCLWLIDPVYADESGRSSNMELLAATSRTLGGFLGHDPNFAHRFSRSPFYTGDSPDRYIWYRQHHRIDRLSDFIREVREVTDEPQHVSPRQEFSSGRELIETVKARREQAQAFRAIADEIETEMGDDADRLNPDLIEGVNIRWISPGRAARDETAFRHALKTAHRLRAAWQRMTDATIIDAYEHAYTIAQREGADGRQPEMPPMRDRQTMARRVRGYVTQGKTDSYGTPTAKYATTSQRKALATMDRRGGQKAAKRWETDPEGECAQGRRATLQKTHRKKKAQGVSNRQRVGLFITAFWVEMDRLPTWAEIQAETGLSRATVARHVSALKESGDLPA